MDNIDNTYPPFQTQRIENYLQDLTCQLRELRQKQEDVTNILLDIIKELYGIFSMLITDQENDDGLQNQMADIKKRIRDFESISKESDMFTILNQQNMDILQTFEQLHKSEIFEKNFLIYPKVKESFEKINTFFGKLNNIKPQNSDMKKYISKGIREKINSLKRFQTDSHQTTSPDRNIFSNNNVAIQTERQLSDSVVDNDSCSYYASCYGSEMSLCKLKTPNDTISTVGYDDDGIMMLNST